MEFLGVPIFDDKGLAKLAFKFALNLFAVIVIVRGLYYPKSKQKDYVFTYFLFSTITFLICFLLRKVPMEMGFALGLFAVFGILRYRTETIAIKEMTYLFIVIGLAMLNALSNKSISWMEIGFANVVIVLLTWGIESFWFKNQLQTKTIVYDNIELVNANNENLLIEDLQKRTGWYITKVEVQELDLLKDTASLKVYYKPK